MKRNIAILLVLALAGALGYGLWRLQHRSRGPELTLYGNVDIREVNLGFRVSGKVREVLKEEGDAVKPGEVIARLDNEPYRHEVAQATAQVALAKAKLDRLTAGYRTEEIEQARANVEEQKATLANAERLFKRRRELLKQAVASQQEYDDAATSLDAARAKLVSLASNLALMESGYRREEIEQARADFAASQAALAASQVHLSDTELKAPSEGMVTTRALEPGAIVQSGATVLTVSLSMPVWVRAYVAEPDLARTSPGTLALLYTDSQPHRAYEGRIGYVSPRAEFTPKSVETPDLRTGLVYQLRVVVDYPDEGLRQGMPVTVKIPPR